jgi:O-acetyl-ADP-ribose deacetylase (regulator of RNase III)
MIRYVTGDATEPLGRGPRIIAHVCNDLGLWGAGFTGALSRKWREPEHEYRTRAMAGLNLGTIQVTNVANSIAVINMVAQRGVRGSSAERANTEGLRAAGLTPTTITGVLGLNRPPIRYDALAVCLQSVAAYAFYMAGFHVMETEVEIEPHEPTAASVHMPRIGCGLAGGKWEEVEPIIQRELVVRGVSVTIYDLPGNAKTDKSPILDK